MTTQESFKKRVRERMAKTGERYAAARQQLLTDVNERGREWKSEPETSNSAVSEATGRGWEEWCDIIDSWPGSDAGHTAIAKHLAETYSEVNSWWAQSITGGWERITGRRLPGEMPDGTFTANKSKTIIGDPREIRSMLLDTRLRADLFPGLSTELESPATAKAIRVAVGPGVAVFGLADKGAGKVTITIQHTKLPVATDVDEWKFYWSDWLDAIESAL